MAQFQNSKEEKVSEKSEMKINKAELVKYINLLHMTNLRISLFSII